MLIDRGVTSPFESLDEVSRAVRLHNGSWYKLFSLKAMELN
jgi:hypothetical protein